jgi:FAD/FMN-containing dehydrogenase
MSRRALPAALLASVCAAAAAPLCADELLAAGVPLAFPRDAAFANATRVNDALFNLRLPPFVALPQTEGHVAAALACASAAGARVALKGGGHSRGGYSSLADGGAFSVSLQDLALRGDAASPPARVEWAGAAPGGAIRATGGARWADVYAFLDAQPPPLRVAAGGLCLTVGLGGHVLGGGVGPLTRERGLAADALLGARVVLANSSGAVDAAAELLFALRGGGGANFGVVIELTLATYPASAAYTWTRACFTAGSAGEAAAFVSLYAAVAPALPRTANADVVLGGGEACVWAVVAGDSGESATALLPLTSAPAPAPRPASLEAHAFPSFWDMLQSYAEERGYAEFGNEPWSSRSCFSAAADVSTNGFEEAVAAPLYGPRALDGGLPPVRRADAQARLRRARGRRRPRTNERSRARVVAWRMRPSGR